MDKLTVGILAHVDAGKTTLSEAMLYRGGRLRRLGRVDHADAFLDTDALERERGITIFAKQAVLPLEEVELTLLDTPGHVDFSAETERTLAVLDCALLVISGPDGIQGHTLTLWRLLKRAGVPTFLFFNKMDQSGSSRTSLLDQARAALSEACLDLSAQEAREEAALGDEAAMEEFLETGALSSDTLRRLVGKRKLFPCLFGSALRAEGVDELLDVLKSLTPRPRRGEVFAARVYKISRDAQGTRLTHLKVTGGVLRVKDSVDLPAGAEKVDQIRIYSGAKFLPTEEAPAGTVCAVTGLAGTRPGQALGAERPWTPPVLEPALAYQLILPEGCDPHGALPKLRELEEEDPQLHLEWNERLGQFHLRLMGTVQAEILRRVISDRFGLAVDFGPGQVVYRETIAAPVEGVGHFEPLRHYAEVHLLLEPGERGSGLHFASSCPEDQLDGHWQRLILTHLAEKVHPGVLTGSPVTDLKIILVSGRAHEKHTEGGDFRQATYRAVRQGLMEAQSVLLEPWYRFRLELPVSNLGRALADLQRIGGETQPPQTVGEEAVLEGQAPVVGLRDYAETVAAYTRGRGRIFLAPGEYRPCANQAEVVEALGYDPERDTENPAGSVFCAHGAGYPVPWDQVTAQMHLPALNLSGEAERRPVTPSRRPVVPAGSLESDKELRDIFEKTYGAIKPRSFQPSPRPTRAEPKVERRAVNTAPAGPEYLLVDGYNIIFAWEDLKVAARENLDAARKALMDLLSNYQGFRRCRVILVFDAYKVPQGTGSVSRYHNIHVVYTKEAETADTYIEKVSYQLSRERFRVKVATSDGAEQLIILGHGALRVSAQDLRAEVERTQGEISAILRANNRAASSQPVRAAFARAEEKETDSPGESNPSPAGRS